MITEKVYIRDGQKCDFCGKLICFEDAYELKFHTNSLVVCKNCNKQKESERDE